MKSRFKMGNSQKWIEKEYAGKYKKMKYKKYLKK